MLSKKIVVVSGLPRSGTSLLMAMLKNGGLPILTDHVRPADIDNPQGYFEWEKVKTISKDCSWLAKARGKAIKIVSPYLKFLPSGYQYQVIFLERKIEEILASQKQMLQRRKKKSEISDAQMKTSFQEHLKTAKAWLKKQPNFIVLYLSYNQTVGKPMIAAKKISNFLNRRLKVVKMAAVVDPRLYRQRR